MNEEDVITVVIPVYNVQEYVPRCIESVIKQTYKNLEIILVDDGSTDTSGYICDEYAKQDERIKVIHKKNGGLSDARNVAIDIAKGKYITFIDSDDYVEVDYIAYLYELIKRNECQISICAHFTENEQQKRVDFGNGYEEKSMGKEEAISRMLCEQGFTVSACAKMYELTLFQNIRYPFGKLCEDNGTTYKLLEKSEKIYYGNSPKYIYSKRTGSIMNSKFSKKKMDLIELTDQMAKELMPKMPNLKDAIIKRQIHSRFSVLRQIVFSKEKDEKQIAKQLRKDVLKNFGTQFFKNTKLDKRDKLAFISLWVGLWCYKINWKMYLKMKG